MSCVFVCMYVARSICTCSFSEIACVLCAFAWTRKYMLLVLVSGEKLSARLLVDGIVGASFSEPVPGRYFLFFQLFFGLFG